MTDIVEVPPAPVVPPFPALGSNNYNDEAYAAGVALPGLSAGIHAIGVAAHTNATAAKEQALAASGSASAAAQSADGAASSADAAADSASASAGSAGAASDSATAAEASRIGASKLNLGDKSAPPALDNQGDPLRGGATYYDTTLKKWRVWTGEAWGDGISAVSGVSSVNGHTGDVVLPPGIINVAYDNRAQLRTNSTGMHALVEGLGLFQYASGSDEPDDDESCFATATGRWLLECPHWDVVADWQLPDDAARDESIGYILRATVACAITTVAAVSKAEFTAFVPGAVAGSAVLVTPMAALDSRLAISARVTGENTVTVAISNPSAAVTAAGGIPASWQITVFMEI